MISIHFIRSQLGAALSRGVRQCVLIGSRPLLQEALTSCVDHQFDVFVPARFSSGDLAGNLGKSDFDKDKPSLFLWLGDTGLRTMDAVLGGLAFIRSLPTGSGVLLDYAVERTALRDASQTALDALASCVACTAGVKYLIQPQAVTSMLRGLGFRHIDEIAEHDLTLGCTRLVSAVV
jgi:O-methyltransferase involved in polyketide biosynthesis